MAFSLLITQCLQADFVGAGRDDEPLPNKLHVGREESRRLLGPEPDAGPLAQFVRWARAQRPDELQILHVRDLHRGDDPKQREHFRLFGPHCVAGTSGARLVLDLEDPAAAGSNEALVDAIGLNDVEETDLRARIEALRARHGELERVGVIGVWTEAKVSFLLYDLKTRLRIDRLATCSALTASNSRAQHFNALEQLRALLGVELVDGVGDFARWLVPDGEAPRVIVPVSGPGPKLALEDGATLPDEDRDVVAMLYREAAVVELGRLSGGFSGASVYRARSRDRLGLEHAPSVVKLGRRADITKERVAFERVEPALGNAAPAVKGFVDLGERAGIRFSFAAMRRGEVRTLKKLFDTDAPLPELERVLARALEILAPLHGAGLREKLSLLAAYDFQPRYADSVAARVEAIAGAGARTRDTLTFPGGVALPNVCRFYDHELAALAGREAGAERYVAYVHGDLNGANVLRDEDGNVWVIDFAHAARTHVLKDLIKLENDLQYLFTPLHDEADLAEALRLTAALRTVRDLAGPLPEVPAGVTRPSLLRCWSVLRLLRGQAAKLCREDRGAGQLSVGLLRYAAHTLSFDEASPLQKRWALAAACGHAVDAAAWLRDGAR